MLVNIHTCSCLNSNGSVVPFNMCVYCVAGKFGRGKAWQIWRITRRSPNLTIQTFSFVSPFHNNNNKPCNTAVGIRQTFDEAIRQTLSPPNIPAIMTFLIKWFILNYKLHCGYISKHNVFIAGYTSYHSDD